MSKKRKVLGGGQPPPAHHRGVCTHRTDGEDKPVTIGGHTIWAGGGLYLSKEDLGDFDHWINLRAEQTPKNIAFGEYDSTSGIIYLPIVDYGIVDEVNWGTWKMVLDVTYQQMTVGITKIVFCAGGHGRTGLFLASLLAMVEPEIDDPVAEIRRRYCQKAVETAEQHAQVMRLLNETRAAPAAATS